MERRRKKEEKEKEQSNKQNREQEKRKQAYEKACGECTNLAPSQWSIAQLQAMISYKKGRLTSGHKSRCGHK
jgi:hypothetical protein